MSSQWIHAIDSDGSTPLDRAFNSGHRAIAEMMLRQEKEDQTEALQDSTPLHRAACLGLSEAVFSLLTYGSDPAARDRQGETPLHQAARAGHVKTVEILLPVSNVNAANNEGMTPIHWACLARRTEVVRVLLAHGADPWVRDESMDGLTAVDIAAMMGYSDLVRLFKIRESYA